MSSSEERRLLVIGLDGGTFDVFRPLIQMGQMPNLSKLTEQGCWGSLSSTIPPFTPTAWSTFITGQNPGQHGILSFQTRDIYNYDVTGTGFVNAERLGTTLWQILSAAGKRVSVINVPMTYPPRAVNGHMIAGMLTPSKQANFVYPPELKSRLGDDYIIDVDFLRDGGDFRMRNFPPEQEMIAEIRQMTSIRTRAVLQLWRDEAPWDFAMVVFTGTDRLFHFFWPYVAQIVGYPNHLGRSNKLDPVVMDAVNAYLTELDGAIGDLVREAGHETSVLLMSDHGFGPAQQWRLYLNIWLEQLGLLTRRSAQGLLDMEYMRVWVGRKPWLKSLLRRLIPQGMQDSATNTAQTSSPGIIDWQNTQAFFVPIYFQICGIAVNQVGLYREGIVGHGNDYERIRDQIIQHALNIRNPMTGKSVVQLACRREEIYHGNHLNEFPDVILVLDPEYVGAQSIAGQLLIEDHPHPMRSGEHRQNGMFVMSGSGIERRGEVPNMRLLDVTPTILYELGVEIPDSFDGVVMTELYSLERLHKQPVRFRSSPAETSQPTPVLSTEEQALIEQRLRGLGYL